MGKRTIKIWGSYSGKVATGPYENANPGFGMEETIEDCDWSVEKLVARQRELQEKCYMNFKAAAESARIEKIQKERESFRFRVAPDGSQMPSVTSVINYDSTFKVSEEDLRQYAAQGTITHFRVDHFVKTAKWETIADIGGLFTERQILTEGRLNLPENAGDFRNFTQKHPIKDMSSGTGKPVFDLEARICGECDFRGTPVGWAAEVSTTFDIKRHIDIHKNAMQISFYAKMNGDEQAILIPLNNDTKQGYSKPVILGKDKIEEYYLMLIDKRRQFEKIYGV